MKRVLASVFLVGCVGDGVTTSVHEAEVLGGTAAPNGKWPDVAAVNFGGFAGCTGTLIAPSVVLTAGHCNGSDLDSVLIGASSLERADEGERIAVTTRVEYESVPGARDSYATEDLTVLVLAQPSRFAPRAIATGWARLDIVNGAPVTIAGYGAIDPDASQYVPELQEAVTTITDADCLEKAGCNVAVMPGGELGAGGMGIDTCNGDSGGPLYLMTDYGTFLAGVTSRAYEDATTPCKDGGIYARPDKVMDWVERSAGVPVMRGPEPSAPPIEVVRGHGAETVLVANDPKGEAHTFAIATPPAHGRAAVRADGRVRVCADPAATGADTVTVRVTDAADPARAVDAVITIAIADGDVGSGCDPEAFDEGGGGCDSGPGGRGAAVLALGLAAVLGRRRRRQC